MSEETVKETLDRLDEILTGFVNDHKMPGLAVGIIRDGELLATRCFGYADLENKIPVTPETVFRIGSISKTFTAAGIMQLWEQGKLGLDDPVNNYLKSYKVLHKDPAAPPVTFRHMLTHTSGIGDMRSLWDLLKPVEGMGADPEDPEIPLGEYYHGLLQPELHPGEKWCYANHAFATLGQLVEDISGEPFGEYNLRHIFEPLGMRTSDFFLTDRVKSALSKAYVFKKGRFKPVEYQRIEVPAAGSVFSTLNDMAKYVAALMNRGANQYGRYVSPETFDVMTAPQLNVDPRIDLDMGLYFVLTHLGDHRIIWHNGGWPGFSSSMWVAPDDKLGVLVFTNTDSGIVDDISRKILRGMLGVPQPGTLVPAKDVLESPHDWPDLLGFYAPKPGVLTSARFIMANGGEMEIFTKDNHLAMRSLLGGTKNAFQLYRADNQNPLFYKGAIGAGDDKAVTNIVFVRNEHGQVYKMLMGTEQLYRRPYRQSLKFKALLAAGSLAVLAGYTVGKRIFKKK